MAPPAVARAEDDGEDEEFQEPSEADAEDLVNDDEDQPETVAPPAPASPAARAANADDRHSPGTSSPKGDAPKEGRMIKVAPSLWGAKRPTTIYFAYPPDVRVSRKGPGPAKEALGGRKLLFRTTWERNCVKNAFALAGFKRVRDGTELSAAKAAAAAAAGGLVADIAGAIGGLLGFGEEAELEAKVPKIPTALPWCASWTKHPSPEIYATQNRFQKVNHFPGSWALGRKRPRPQKANGATPGDFAWPFDAAAFCGVAGVHRQNFRHFDPLDARQGSFAADFAARAQARRQGGPGVSIRARRL